MKYLQKQWLDLHLIHCWHINFRDDSMTAAISASPLSSTSSPNFGDDPLLNTPVLEHAAHSPCFMHTLQADHEKLIAARVPQGVVFFPFFSTTFALKIEITCTFGWLSFESGMLPRGTATTRILHS